MLVEFVENTDFMFIFIIIILKLLQGNPPRQVWSLAWHSATFSVSKGTLLPFITLSFMPCAPSRRLLLSRPYSGSHSPLSLSFNLPITNLTLTAKLSYPVESEIR